MLTFYNKIAKIFFKVAALLIIGELILMLTGFFYYQYYALMARPPGDFDKTAFRILCIGESTTFGYPVHKNGYPEQLEYLLNKNIPDKRFKVFNLGICAITSNEIARHFYKNIIDYKPDLIIMLVGNNSNRPRLFYMPDDKNIINRAAFYFIDKLNRLKLVRLFKFSYEVLNGLITKRAMFHKINSDIYLSYNMRSPYSERELKNNLKYMIDIASKNKCRILISNYFDSECNDFLRKFATANHISFCDNEKIFKEYKNAYSELLSKDGWHPSLKGYSLIAKIYTKLLLNIIC